MSTSCAIAECKNSTKAKKLRGSDLQFHRFPNDAKLRAVWVTKCKRGDRFNPKTSKICSDHFSPEDYQRDLKSELLNLPPLKKLKSSAVPSIFSFRHGQTGSGTISKRRMRAHKRQSKQLVNDLLNKSSTDAFKQTNSDGNESLQGEDDKEDHPAITNDERESLQQLIGAINEAQTSPILESKSCDFCTDARNKVAALESKLKTALHLIECHKSEMLRLETKLVQSTKLKPSKQVGHFTQLTTAQLKKLNGKLRVNWSTEDIVKALSIRSISLKAYETVRNLFQLPLPAARTLSSWSQKFSCDEGALHEVIRTMGNAISSMSPMSKLAVLSFDEIALDSTAVVDPTFGNVSSFSKAQVIFVRGLCCPWKQPVYYKFDQNVTKKILWDMILTLEKTGIRVCATVCDLGPSNLKLFRELGVTVNSVSFPNPADPSRQVYVFADIPHCLKNLRNHVLDHGGILPEGHCVDKNILLKMVAANGRELKLVKHLDESVLNLSGPQRMRVRNAVQFFSHSMASLAWKCFPDRPGIGNFFEIINNGFDVLNSRFTFDKKNKLRSGYGLFMEDQLEAIDTLECTIESLRFKTPKGKARSVLLPCQQGFLISIRSLKGLYKDLKLSDGLTYILTSRLNQDSLESLFGRIRSFGGPNTHPTAVEFRYRLKLVLLGGSTKPLKGCNVEEDFGTDYLSKNLLQINSHSNETTEEELKEDVELKMINMAQTVSQIIH